MSQEVIEITEREIEVIEVVEKGPAGPVGPQANINYTVVSSPQTLSNSQNIAADTSGGALTLTLPANPNAGDSIDIFDYSETFDTNPLTIARNGQRIESLEENLICNVEGAYFTMIYTGATRGWQILPRYGTSGGAGESVLTTQGDMLYRAVGVNARLPIGSAGQILKVNSGATAPEWGAAPATGVTSVSGTAPIASSGGATPTISITAATTGAAGSMSSADKTKLDAITGTNTGDQTITLTGNVTGSGTGSFAATIANDAVTNAKLANMATATIKGRATASTGDPEDLSASQVRTILNVADGAEVNVQSNWTEANSGSDAFILNKPTLGTAAAAATTDFAAAVHAHAAADVTTGTFDNARINFAAPPAIGNTTPAAGTFTTLAANNGTIYASAPVLDLAQTWNDGGTAFSGLQASFTNDASATDSSFFSIFLDATETFAIRRGANAGGSATIIRGGGAGGLTWTARTRTGGGVGLNFQHTLGIGASLEFLATASGTTQGDVALVRDGVGVLGQRRGANAQTFNIYNTFTSDTNHERGFLKWSSNVFQIGTEKGSGGGTARALDFQIDGTNVFSLGRSGGPRIAGLTNYVSNVDSVANIGFSTFGYVAGGANNSGGIAFYDGNGSGVSTRLGLDASNVLGIKSGTAAQAFRIYNTTTWERLNIRWASNECIIDTEAGGTGTLRGLKIGSATSSLLGFYGATPVDRPATVADPAGGGTIDTEARTAINDIIDRLQELGLIA